MPDRALVIEVRLLERRWHGVGDWPPSPFRLFQALVAGAYGGRWRSEPDQGKDAAFRWLETLAPPAVAAPPRTALGPVTYFVPNNDLDTVDGDPARTAEIRAAKHSRSILLEGEAPFLYAWRFDAGDEAAADRLAGLADRLHTFGRGVDAAFARGELLDPAEAEARLLEHGGAVSRPSATFEAGGGDLLACPGPGSLDSLKARHAATVKRFTSVRDGRRAATLFRQPPTALDRRIAYARPPAQLLFDLRPAKGHGFSRRPQEQVAATAKAVRDGLAERLCHDASDATRAQVERLVIGRGAGPADAPRRLRVTPLPSIGGPNTDPSIRRVLAEVPPDCPLPARRVARALSGFELPDPETGELLNATLTPADDLRMLGHYGIGPQGAAVSARRWRTVTPAALPLARLSGRLGGGERLAQDAELARAAAAALRHAGVDARLTAVRVQAEPFFSRGARAEAFAFERFGADRLYHLELEFDRGVAGPLIVGDGRWYGLGLMRPAPALAPTAHLFEIVGQGPPAESRVAVLRALRRAVLARVQAVVNGSRGEGRGLDPFFHGHDPAGAPARPGDHRHLFFLADDADGDGRLDRLAIVAPQLADRKASFDTLELQRHLRTLERACAGLTTLRAGQAGVLQLVSQAAGQARPFARSRSWVSLTPYRPTRHPRRGEAAAPAVVADLQQECRRRGLPAPQVEVLEVTRGPRGGLAARLRLRFPVVTAGPMLLGMGSHFGDGLFGPEA